PRPTWWRATNHDRRGPFPPVMAAPRRQVGSPPMRRLTTIILSSMLLVAAACGDDDGGGGGDLSSEEQEYVDAAMAEFDAEEAEPLTESDARCIVSSMVDKLGVDRLGEIGITPESFGSEDGAPFPEDLT